jgi:hypothetical protein
MDKVFDLDELSFTEEEVMSEPTLDIHNPVAPPSSIVMLDSIERMLKEMNVRYQMLHWLHYSIKTAPPSEEVLHYLMDRIGV